MVKAGMLSYEELAEALRNLESAIADLVATINGAVTGQLEKLNNMIKDRRNARIFFINKLPFFLFLQL